MSITIIVEITNKLLQHVSTHEMSSSGSSLVLTKITYECKNNKNCTVPLLRLSPPCSTQM